MIERLTEYFVEPGNIAYVLAYKSRLLRPLDMRQDPHILIMRVDRTDVGVRPKQNMLNLRLFLVDFLYR